MAQHRILNVLIAFVDSTWLLILLVPDLSLKATEEQRGLLLLVAATRTNTQSLGDLMMEGGDERARPKKRKKNEPAIIGENVFCS